MKKIIIINFVAIVFIILFLELIVRFLNLSGLMGIDSGLIYEKNNINYLVPGSSGLLFNAKVYIDSNGYRVPTKSYKYKASKSLLFIGDSTTFGNGVIEEETFVGRLRKEFNEINFINTAVPGYQVKHYAQNLPIYKDIANVDTIIYVITLNDVFSSSNVVNLTNEKKFQENGNNFFLSKLSENIIIKELNFILRNKSYLYMYIKGTFSDPPKRYFKNVHKFYKENEILSLLNLIKNLKEISNSNLHIVTLPYEYQTRECTEDALYPQNKIKEMLSNIKINYYDFTKYFCNSKNPKQKFYKFDPMHLSVEGHELVYNLLKNRINF